MIDLNGRWKQTAWADHTPWGKLAATKRTPPIHFGIYFISVQLFIGSLLSVFTKCQLVKRISWESIKSSLILSELVAGVRSPSLKEKQTTATLCNSSIHCCHLPNRQWPLVTQQCHRRPGWPRPSRWINMFYRWCVRWFLARFLRCSLQFNVTFFSLSLFIDGFTACYKHSVKVLCSL